VIPPKSSFVAFHDFSANAQLPHVHQEDNRQAECHPQSRSDAIFAHAKGKWIQLQNAFSKTETGYTSNSTLVDTAVLPIGTIGF